MTAATTDTTEELSPEAAPAAARMLAPSDVRARRRPLAILAVSAYTLGWGWLVATPVHAWAKRVWGAHPLGDEVLFRPGGRELLTWLFEGDAALAVVITTSFMLLLVGIVLGNVVFGALVAALATTEGRRTDPVRIGFASFAPLTGASFAAGAIQTAILALGMFAAGAAARFCEPRWGDALAFDVRLVVLALAASVACLIGVVADIARTAIVREIVTSSARAPMLRRIGDAALFALSLVRRRFGAVVGGWLARSVPSLALLALGWAIGSAAGARGGVALFFVFLARQAVVVARVALRASWIARILRFGS